MIDLAKTNTADIETLQTLIWLASSLIVVLLSIVSYFLNKQIQVSETLTKAVNSLTTAVTVLESQSKDRYPVIEKRLNSHEDDIDVIKTQLARIETVCKYNHSKNRQ